MVTTNSFPCANHHDHGSWHPYYNNSVTLNHVLITIQPLLTNQHSIVLDLQHDVHILLMFPLRVGPHSIFTLSRIIPKLGGKQGCFQSKLEEIDMPQEGSPQGTCLTRKMCLP